MQSFVFKTIQILPKLWTTTHFCTASTATKKNLKPFLEKWRTTFRSAHIEDSDFTLKCLVAHSLNENFSSLTEINNIKMTEEQLQKLERYCECRVARIPLQYIIGEWEFRNLTLKMFPSVFIPRPETEKLVDLIIKEIDLSQNFEFIEIGCGTGAISLSVLNEHKYSTAIALDHSKAACSLTMENARLLGLKKRIKVYNYKVEKNNLVPDELSKKKFNLVVSNPPYIKTDILHTLAPEIKLYENLTALDGGRDGLKVAKIIIDLASECLLKNGKLWMELDESHPPLIEKFIDDKYSKVLKYVAKHNDIFGKNRFVEILKIS